MLSKAKMAALEAERYDISYRKLKTVKAPPEKTNKAAEILLNERYKAMFFHAGRYAAGDRDVRAKEAWKSYEAYEGLK